MVRKNRKTNSTRPTSVGVGDFRRAIGDEGGAGGPAAKSATDPSSMMGSESAKNGDDLPTSVPTDLESCTAKSCYGWLDASWHCVCDFNHRRHHDHPLMGTTSKPLFISVSRVQDE